MSNQYHSWTTKQIEFIKGCSGQYTRQAITNLFNKKFNTSLSIGSIDSKRYDYDVEVIENEVIHALYKGESLIATGSIREIACEIGISYFSVWRYGSDYYKRMTSPKARRLVKLGVESECGSL